MLIKDLPGGFTKIDDVKADAGPSDLDKAVHDEGGGNNVREALVADGFIVGFQRGWQSSDGQSIIDFVYSFKTEAGASSHTDAVIKLVTSDSKRPTKPFSVSGIPGAVGVVKTDKSSTAHIVNFQAKTFGVQVVVVTPSGGAELANKYAQDQYRILNEA